MIYVTFLITFVYAILILSFIIGFDKVKLFKTDGSKSKNTFTIIIPFRDEAKNLSSLLESLSALNYPKELFEIILVNDDSTDDSVEVIKCHLEQSREARPDTSIIDNIRKSNSPKKDAIETAIQQSKFDWIVTTDADCIVPKKWLQLFDEFIQKNDSEMICAPVTYNLNNSLLEQFQLLDFISLIGSTIGNFGIKKPFLCNGANLCYSKKSFHKVNGFEGNDNIASGDDIFLLEKINATFPSKIYFLKSFDSVVFTEPQHTFKQLISQRVRWASKTKSYQNWFGKFVGISVLLMNLLIILLVIYSLLDISVLKTLTLVFLIKSIVDFTLIFKTLIFTKQSKNITSYPIIAILHPFFIVFTTFLSIFKNSYNWKKRTFKL